MIFVSTSDFVMPYVVPNIDRLGTTFNDFATSKELEALIKVIGVRLTLDFVNGIQMPVPDQRWLDLRDGKTFQHFGTERLYRGVKSVVLPYIYSRWIRFNHAHFTGVGTAVADAENAQKISSEYVEAQFYNEASEASEEMQRFIESNISDYPGYVRGHLGYMNVLCL
jgi:hypothetical protein